MLCHAIAAALITLQRSLTARQYRHEAHHRCMSALVAQAHVCRLLCGAQVRYLSEPLHKRMPAMGSFGSSEGRGPPQGVSWQGVRLPGTLAWSSSSRGGSSGLIGAEASQAVRDHFTHTMAPTEEGAVRCIAPRRCCIQQPLPTTCHFLPATASLLHSTCAPITPSYQGG